MSDSGLSGVLRHAVALPVAALLVVLLLGATDGGAQSGGSSCDAAYCCVQSCERGPPNCRCVPERVCLPAGKQECTTRNVRGVPLASTSSRRLSLPAEIELNPPFPLPAYNGSADARSAHVRTLSGRDEKGRSVEFHVAPASDREVSFGGFGLEVARG